MNTFNVKKDSWHYRLAVRYGMLSSLDFLMSEIEIDFCKYVRNVILGGFMLLLIGIFSLFMLAPVMYPISWAVASIVTSNWYLPSSADNLFWIGLAILVGAATIAVIVVLLSTGVEIAYSIKNKFNKNEKEPSFVSQAYDSFKNKYCIKVKVVE